MSVSNGQNADETTFNGAFISKLINSTTIGIVTLNNNTSGGIVSNTQQAINTNIADIADHESRITTLETSVVKSNFTSTQDPTVNDDVDLLYEVGSQWINTITRKIFQCVDATDGAAIWKRIDKIMLKVVEIVTHDFGTTPVTDSAYVELIASTGADFKKAQMFYPDGDAMIVAVGAAASEVDNFYILAGGTDSGIEIEIPAGSRLSMKLITGGTTNNTGKLSINFLGEA